jgi:uncharacterized protein YndB with AHSA1/START domain
MRSVVTVIVAFVALNVFILLASLAPWYILGVDGLLEPNQFKTPPAFDVYAVLVGIFGSVQAGRWCGRMAESRIAVIVLALLCFAGGTINSLAQSEKPDPGFREPGLSVLRAISERKEPDWFIFLMPMVGLLGVMYGGRRAGQSPSKIFEFVTVANIRAQPASVWEILTNPASYEKWNPEIVAIAGQMGFGERIKARVKVGSGAIRTVPLRVTTFEPPTRMDWTGGLPLGYFTGLRILTVTPKDGQTEFRMVVCMSGPLAPSIVKSVGNRQKEIDGFSAALKEYAERTS